MYGLSESGEKYFSRVIHWCIVILLSDIHIRISKRYCYLYSLLITHAVKICYILKGTISSVAWDIYTIRAHFLLFREGSVISPSVNNNIWLNHSVCAPPSAACIIYHACIWHEQITLLRFFINTKVSLRYGIYTRYTIQRFNGVCMCICTLRELETFLFCI